MNCSGNRLSDVFASYYDRAPNAIKEMYQGKTREGGREEKWRNSALLLMQLQELLMQLHDSPPNPLKLGGQSTHDIHRVLYVHRGQSS